MRCFTAAITGVFSRLLVHQRVAQMFKLQIMLFIYFSFRYTFIQPITKLLIQNMAINAVKKIMDIKLQKIGRLYIAVLYFSHKRLQATHCPMASFASSISKAVINKNRLKQSI